MVDDGMEMLWYVQMMEGEMSCMVHGNQKR